jgi:hypothetical protein
VNDLSTDETIRTAFAELRYAEPPRFAPPGVDAARRTVHRRRLGNAATAGLAIVALLGGGYLAVTGIDRPGVDWPGSPTEGWNSMRPEDLVDGGDPELTRLAADAVRYDDPSNPAVAGGIADLNPATDHSSTYVPGVGGTFLVRVSCAGPGGSVTLIAQVRGRHDPHQATAQCATTADEVAAGVGETTIELGDADDIVDFDLTRSGTAQWGASGIWPIVAHTITRL